MRPSASASSAADAQVQRLGAEPTYAEVRHGRLDDHREAQLSDRREDLVGRAPHAARMVDAGAAGGFELRALVEYVGRVARKRERGPQTGQHETLARRPYDCQRGIVGHEQRAWCAPEPVEHEATEELDERLRVAAPVGRDVGPGEPRGEPGRTRFEVHRVAVDTGVGQGAHDGKAGRARHADDDGLSRMCERPGCVAVSHARLQVYTGCASRRPRAVRRCASLRGFGVRTAHKGQTLRE